MQGPSWGRKPTREAEKDRTEGNPESVVARSSNECSGGKDHQTHWTPGEDGKYKHRLDLVKWESVTLTRTVSVSNEGRSQMYWVEEWHILKKKRTLLLSHWVVSSPMDYIVHQAPLPVEFSRWEYWSGLPSHTPGDLPHPGIKPTSLVFPALAGSFFTTVPQGKPRIHRAQNQTRIYTHIDLRISQA